ncbi:MAG: hypothetical protein ACLQG3_03790 [Terracidiphilus sp.]
MEERILFATHCHWMKFDLDPQQTKDWGAPLNGTLFVTDTALEFSGRYKAYGGNLLSSAVTATMVRMIGDVTFAVPLRLIRGVQAIQTSESFLFIKKEAVRLEVLYQRDPSSSEMRKVVCYPHFGLAPPNDPQSVQIAPEIAALYQPNVAQAFNWERVLRRLTS